MVQVRIILHTLLGANLFQSVKENSKVTGGTLYQLTDGSTFQQSSTEDPRTHLPKEKRKKKENGGFGGRN